METIYTHELKQFANDSRLSLLARLKRKYRHINSMRNTVTQFTVMLMVGTVITTTAFV